MIKNQNGMSIMQFIVATAVGLSTTFAIGAILQSVLNRQKEVSSMVSNIMGWNEIVANILSPKSVTLMLADLSPEISACVAGVGVNCTSYSNPAETPINLAVIGAKPFFGPSAGCLQAATICPMERRLARQITCQSVRNCTVVMRLAILDHTKVLKGEANSPVMVKDRRFPLSNATPDVASIDFQACTEKPVGIDYVNSRVVCASPKPISCNGLSVTGAGQGQCGSPINSTSNGICQISFDNANPEDMSFSYQAVGPHRFSYKCDSTGAVTEIDSEVIYGSDPPDKNPKRRTGKKRVLDPGDVAKGKGTKGGLTVKCVGTVTDENKQVLGTCEAEVFVGPPATTFGVSSGSGRSSPGNTPASVSGNGSGFTSSFGASF